MTYTLIGTVPVEHLMPGDIVNLGDEYEGEDDDFAVIKTAPRNGDPLPEGGHELTLWVKGDKLPVYFKPGEMVRVYIEESG